ncbi:MAG: DHA2 family efflux MFS transporter permease subunit, partial [Solirubrobacteraceae bacterium]
LLSLVLVTAGSALCGLAGSSTELIVFRVLQGVGGGMIMPVGQLMLAEAAGPKRMGRVMSIVAVPMLLAPILGPTIGGLIIDSTSWRWIFYVNVPIGVIAVVASMRILPSVGRQPVQRLDLVGLALIATGLPLLTYGLAEVGTLGSFTAAKVLVPGLLGIALVASFCVYELRKRTGKPLLDLHLYRKTTFSTASLATFCIGAALFGAMILLPLYWQTVRGDSALVAGALLAPQGLGAALMMPLAGKLTDRWGGGPLALLGVIAIAGFTIPFGMIGAHTSVAWLCVVMFLRGTGLGFAMMPTMAAAYAALDRAELSDATPQLNVLQRVGGSIGTAVLAVVLQRAMVGAHSLGDLAGAYGTAFWWSAALAAAAIIPAVVLWRAEHVARARARRERPADGQSEPHLEAIGA